MMIVFGDAIFNNDPDLAMFRYKKENKKIMSHNDFENDIKMQGPKGVF